MYLYGDLFLDRKVNQFIQDMYVCVFVPTLCCSVCSVTTAVRIKGRLIIATSSTCTK